MALTAFELASKLTLDNSPFKKTLDDSKSEGTKGGNDTATNLMNALKNTAVKLASTLAIGKTISQSITSAMDFQDSMAKMSTLFDTTKYSAYGLQCQFEDLSNETGKSATELAEAGYQALSAGQDVGNVTDFVKTSVNLAKAGFTDTTTAVDVLTTAMNAYGSKAGSADEISNKLVRTQNLGKTTVGELASAMGKIIPTASSMNVNIDNLTSGYVSLTKQGIATAEATTYMNGMLNELGDSGTTLGGVLKDKTGKSFQELMDSGMSLADVLKITKDYADENGIAYNELWGSAEAGKAGMAILNGGVDEFNKTVETMASDVDDVGDALEKLDTPQAKIGRATNVLKNDLMSFGMMLVDTATPAIGVFTDGIVSIGSRISQVLNESSSLGEALETLVDDAIKWMEETITSDAPEAGKKLVKSVVNGVLSSAESIVGSLGKLLNYAIPFALQIGTEFISTAIQTMGQVTDKIPEFLDQALQLLTSFSSNLADSAGTLVDVGLDFLIKFVQGIADGLPSLIEQVPQIIINFCSIINDNAPKVLEAGFQMLVILGKGIINAIPTLIENIPQIFKAIFSVWQALNWVDLGKNLITFVKNGVSSLSTQIPEALHSIGDKAKEWFKNIDWRSAGSSVVNFITGGVRSLPSLVANAVKAIGQTAVNAFGNINWRDLGVNLVKGIWYGISNMTGWIIDLIGGFANSVVSSIKKFFGIHSPSKVMKDEVGKMLMLGLDSGIDENSQTVFKAMNEVAEGVMESTSDLDTGFSVSNPNVSNLTGAVATKTAQAVSSATTNMGGVTIVINGAEDDEKLAEMVMEKLQHIAERKESAFA